jgi:asparagine synthase (glutamine-hydrolysing)
MCGIAALFHGSGAPLDRRRLLRMMSLLAHRGPDGGGWLEDDGTRLLEGSRDEIEPRSSRAVPGGPFPRGPRLAMGHQRLAVTDLSEAGLQPMRRAEGRWWIAFNGAIYNAPELRTELEGLGEAFSTETDTEVLLAAYARWGTEALPRLNGMWAFALWDARERKLLCARDRFGIKPLYYMAAGGLLALSSEPKGLRPVRALSPDLDIVRRYLACGGSTGGGPATCYENVSALPEGSVLRADAAGVRVERWYDLDERVRGRPRPPDLAGAAEQLRGLLASSVRLRLRADVPAALLLSGGVDSSGIAGIVAHTENGVRGAFSGVTISTRYPGRPDIDETAYAGDARRATGFRGEFVEPTIEGFDRDLDEFVCSVDALVPRSVFYAGRLLYRRCRELNLPVALAGQGSDELFGGYEPWDVYARQLWGRGARLRALEEAWRSSVRQWGAWRGLRHTLGIVRTASATQPCGCRADGTLQGHQRHLLLADYLPTLLAFEDRNSMAWGVEARLPFLDHRVVEFARSLPDDYLLRRGWTKVVLREALRGLVPESVLARPTKMGLPGPVEGAKAAGSRLAGEAWKRLVRGGWIDPRTVPRPRSDTGDSGFRVRVLDAWTRRCLGADTRR